MKTNKIEELSRLTEYAYQSVREPITLENDQALIQAVGFFKNPYLLTAMGFDDGIDLVKKACAGVLKILEALHEAKTNDYEIRYNKPVYLFAGKHAFSSVSPMPSDVDKKASFEIWAAGPSVDRSKKLKKVYYHSMAGVVLDLIDGMPPDRLKRCEEHKGGGECDRLFIQQTGREKRY